MRSAALSIAGALVAAITIVGCGSTDAQSGGKVVPYKLGTFERNGAVFIGVSLRDSHVMDLTQANAAWEGKNASAPKMTVPASLNQLIADYDAQWKPRLAAIASAEAGTSNRPAYEFTLDSLRILPPTQPGIVLNAGGNYVEHEQGIATQAARAAGAQAAPAAAAAPPPPPAESAPGIWERKPDDKRENPYLFIKSPTIVTGARDPIVAPMGRERLDFECEFSLVIGKPAKHVSIDKAADYIFGYTIQIDVSDRGGRGDRKMGGSDWLVGKNHDTFGPIGPYVVPKEFVAKPTNTRHTFKLNGEVMQDSNTSRMTHNIYELVSYASNILTLRPGDVIAGGSPAGTNIERADPRWMRAGDTAVCTIEGIGEQTHQVVNYTPQSTD